MAEAAADTWLQLQDAPGSAGAESPHASTWRRALISWCLVRISSRCPQLVNGASLALLKKLLGGLQMVSRSVCSCWPADVPGVHLS